MAKPSDRRIVRCVKVESCSINRALVCICVAATKPLKMQLMCCGLHYEMLLLTIAVEEELVH